jgi:hypothetical protein
MPSSSSHSLTTFSSSLLPFHKTHTHKHQKQSHPPLDIQHFLKPFRITSIEIHCHAIINHVEWVIHLHFLVYKLTWAHEEDPQFSPQMVLVALWILNTCSWVLCCVCGLINLSSRLFL